MWVTQVKRSPFPVKIFVWITSSLKRRLHLIRSSQKRTTCYKIKLKGEHHNTNDNKDNDQMLTMLWHDLTRTIWREKNIHPRVYSLKGSRLAKFTAWMIPLCNKIRFDHIYRLSIICKNKSVMIVVIITMISMIMIRSATTCCNRQDRSNNEARDLFQLQPPKRKHHCYLLELVWFDQITLYLSTKRIISTG